MPDLMNFFCSPSVGNTLELPDHIQRACETPVRAWTTDLKESLVGPTVLERMRLGLIHQGRSRVILENAFAAMSRISSKFITLTASHNDKVEELNQARLDTELA